MFQCSRPGWHIYTAKCLASFDTSGPTLIVYHPICPMDNLYLSMYVGYFSSRCLMNLEITPIKLLLFVYHFIDIFLLGYFCVRTFSVLTSLVVHSKKLLHSPVLFNVKLQINNFLNIFQLLPPSYRKYIVYMNRHHYLRFYVAISGVESARVCRASCHVISNNLSFI